MSLKFNSRKGQATVIDFTVAFMIFLGVFLINYYAWTSIETKIANNEDKHYFTTSVQQATESLIKTTGTPVDWEKNPSQAVNVGLALKENVLSTEKLQALNNTSYETLKEKILSTGDYEIIISNNEGTLFSIGKSPEGIEIIRVERLIKIENEYYNFVFKGWRT